MSDFTDRLIRLFENIHPLDQIARAGYVLRGVADPESVAAHSHFVALLTLLIVDEYPDMFDSHRALAMALVHDLPECKLMDIPVPTVAKHLGAAKEEAEQGIIEELFEGFPSRYADLHRELIEAKTPEAQLVRGVDKAQMLLKIHCYQREGRGRLDEFWKNAWNFPDHGLKPLRDLFDAICRVAGRPRPE